MTHPDMREAYFLETYKVTEEELRNSMTLFSAVALINAYNAASAAACTAWSVASGWP